MFFPLPGGSATWPEFEDARPVSPPGRLVRVLLVSALALWAAGLVSPSTVGANSWKSYDLRNDFDTGDPIHADTRSYRFSQPLFTFNGPMPFTYQLAYTSFANYFSMNQAFGHSYSDSRAGVVRDSVDGAPTVTNLNGEFTQLAFENLSGYWQLEGAAMYGYALHEYGALESLYLLDYATQRLYVFRYTDEDGNAVLRYIMDPNGNTLSFTDTSIADGLGRSLALERDAFGRITTVTDHSGRVIAAATYGEGGQHERLSALTDAMGNQTSFEYATDFKHLSAKHLPAGNTPFTQEYEDNRFGRVVTQTDAYGNATTLSDTGYYGEDLLVTRPDASTVRYTYGDAAITDPTGKSMAFSYNEDGRFAGGTDRLGGTVSCAMHEPSGLPATVTNAGGLTIRFIYGERLQQYAADPDNGHVESFIVYDVRRIIYPDGSSETYDYDEHGNILAFTDRRGNSWAYTYNAAGQVLTVTNPLGGVLTSTYNADGTLAGTTDSDPGSETVLYAYDTLKRLVGITYPGGAQRSFTYDDLDRLISLTDENGNTTSFVYDANGNVTKVVSPDGSETGMTYDLMDRIRTITNRLGGKTTFAYDVLGQVVSAALPTGVTVNYGYDPRGWRNSVTLNSKTWATLFDDEGVVSGATSPSGLKTEAGTDTSGLLTSVASPLSSSGVTYNAQQQVASVTDPNGGTTSFSYDAAGALVGLTLPSGDKVVCARNALGQVSSITDLNGEQWRMGYSANGRLTSITDPLSRIWRYTYDSRGRLKTVVYPDGGILTLTCDGVGNIVSRQYTGGLEQKYTFNKSNLLTATTGLGLTRDAAGNVTNTRNPGPKDCGAVYDAAGRLTRVTYDNGAFAVTYGYAPDSGLLVSVSDDLTHAAVSFSYDEDNRLTAITRSNGVHSSCTYDAAGRLTGLAHGSVVNLAFTLDAAGQVTRREMTAPLDPGALLVSATRTLTFDAACQTSSTGYAHDSHGRVTTTPRHSLTWAAASRLTGVNGATLTYNGLNDCLTRSWGGTAIRYLYNLAVSGRPIMAEVDAASGGALRYYVWTPGGQLLYMIDAAADNSDYHYLFDRIGSTLALTDKSGVVTDAYAYTPYGLQLAHEGGSAQPFTFLGRAGVRREGDAGDFYQIRARFYDAATGRFVSKDPNWPDLYAPLELDPYLYAMASPISLLDSNGAYTTAERQQYLNLAGKIQKMEPRTSWFNTDVLGVVGQGNAFVQRLRELPYVDSHVDYMELLREFESYEGHDLTYYPDALEKLQHFASMAVWVINKEKDWAREADRFFYVQRLVGMRGARWKDILKLWGRTRDGFTREHLRRTMMLKLVNEMKEGQVSGSPQLMARIAGIINSAYTEAGMDLPGGNVTRSLK